jgi:tetratricopeptide (TPR) repeat protein
MRLLIIVALLVTVQQDDRAIERAASAGWTSARSLAASGGALDQLGPVNARLKELDGLQGDAARYAEIAIRAAVSAAQDEQAELELFLQHARDLANLMELTGNPARWPVPIDELEGELWLEVDRFPEARDAYERATKLKPTPNAWVGLARSADKLGDRVMACRAYGNAATTPNLPPSVELEISVYRLKCK